MLLLPPSLLLAPNHVKPTFPLHSTFSPVCWSSTSLNYDCWLYLCLFISFHNRFHPDMVQARQFLDLLTFGCYLCYTISSWWHLSGWYFIRVKLTDCLNDFYKFLFCCYRWTLRETDATHCTPGVPGKSQQIAPWYLCAGSPGEPSLIITHKSAGLSQSETRTWPVDQSQRGPLPGS